MELFTKDQVRKFNVDSRRILKDRSNPRNGISFLSNKLAEELGELLEAIDEYDYEDKKTVDNLHGEIADVGFLLFQINNLYSLLNLTHGNTLPKHKSITLSLSIEVLKINEFSVMEMGLSRKTIEGKYGMSKEKYLTDLLTKCYDLLNLSVDRFKIEGVWEYDMERAIRLKSGRCLRSHGIIEN